MIKLTPRERIYWHGETLRMETAEVKHLKLELKKAEKRKANAERLWKIAVAAEYKEPK